MEAWVTLATNDSYCVGALVLAASLRKANTTRSLVILTTKGISESMVDRLNESFDEVVVVDPLDSGDLPNLMLMDRPELGITFTKLHCWTLTKYTKCVFLDADTLVVKNSDDLFDREEFSAAPDAGWPDCFNSGVFVFRPNLNTFREIIKFASVNGSFDGGDQGLLNHYFSSWASEDIKKHLPFLYNMCATSTYTYLPAYKHYGADVKIIHFIGCTKPWHVNFDTAGTPMTRPQDGIQDHLRMWWEIFTSDVKPKLTGMNVQKLDNVGNMENVKIVHQTQEQTSTGINFGGVHRSQEDRREHWETGSPDFTGAAAFDNIMKKIEHTMSVTKAPNETESSKASDKPASQRYY